MNNWEAFILGIIQGLTEFLPISSSGHLELGNYLLNTSSSESLLFTITVHIATALSIIIVFKNDIKKIIVSFLKFSINEETIFISKILLSSIPIGIIGIFFEEKIENLFNGNILLVGSMLVITSIFLAFTYLQKNNSKKNISYTDALMIGIAQAIAILPGISRSGITISTALLLKVNKKEATKFSFLMVLVPILGIMILKITKGLLNIEDISSDIKIDSLIIGFFSALISGIFACKWMIKIVEKSNLMYFSIYCLLVGIFALITGCSNSKIQNEKIFTIEPQLPVENLRGIALNSTPPQEEDVTNKSKELYEIIRLDPSIKLDIRYATTRNFMQTPFYQEPKAFLLKEVANMLVKAHKELNNYSLGIVIYDAYRPWYITKMFWDATPDSLKEFVADPREGSVHNRGCAVDIGLYNIETNKIIKMISGYDEFTKKAYPLYEGGTKKERETRDLLINTMKKYDFEVYEYEWWHFNYKYCNSKIMNLQFHEVDSILNQI